MPDFTLHTQPPNQHITDAEWWFWQEFRAFERSARLGGIYADKPGFHNTGNANAAKYPGNYSIRDSVNRTGPWWRTYASAIDLTFPDAQAGDYRTIDKYTSRLMASSRSSADPRLDLVLFEFYGQDDNDKQVEGYNEYREEFVTSDPSHLWHLHLSFLRSKCGDFWGMWALLTVLMGQSVSAWSASLPQPPVVHTGRMTDMFYLQVKGSKAIYVSNGINTRAVPGDTGTYSDTVKPLVDGKWVPPVRTYDSLEDLLNAGGPLLSDSQE